MRSPEFSWHLSKCGARRFGHGELALKKPVSGSSQKRWSLLLKTPVEISTAA